MSEVKGVLVRFAKRGKEKVYLTEYNHDLILWVVKNGIVIQMDNYYREEEEAHSAFERAKNDL